jgi:hypothetical protein
MLLILSQMKVASQGTALIEAVSVSHLFADKIPVAWYHFLVEGVAHVCKMDTSLAHLMFAILVFVKHHNV